jgi:hypothetical protein
MVAVEVATFAMLVLVAGFGLGAFGCGSRKAAVPLLGGGTAAAGSGGAAGARMVVLTEEARLAAPPSSVGNRFDRGWEVRREGGRELLVPTAAATRLQVVHLGEEVARTLTLDLAAAGLPDGERVSVRTGERELARGTLRAAALPWRIRMPEDLPVGQLALDLVFSPPAAPPSPRALATPASLPALYGATLTPALRPGSARVEGGDVVIGGNCLVYISPAGELRGNEALVGTFVPPRDARAGQRFDLSVERMDGTPIRRFHWVPSFWNNLRGARSFELPLRGTRGPVRVRLISRAAADPAHSTPSGTPMGRWQGLALADVTGEILTPGQGQ